MSGTNEKRIFLITGATGETGRYTTELLLARGHHVRAFAHKNDSRSEALAKAGAEIVIGDLLRFRDVKPALQGADGAYFVYPVAEGLLQATTFFAQAALEARVAGVVNMSQLPARPDAASHASFNHWMAERVFDWSGLNLTHLRPTLFAEWLLYFAGMTGRDNVLRLPFRDGRHAPVAAEDQARVIAAILEMPAAHRGKTYKLFGPVELTFPEIAAEMSRALGRDIRYEPLDGSAFAQLATRLGLTEFVIQHIGEIAKDFSNGVFSGTGDVVREVGGCEPMTIHEFTARHADKFGTTKN